MKKVLLISYHFPPDTAVGGLRAAKFARHLPACGWEPMVLTAFQDKRALDRSRLEGLEGLKIFKAAELPALRGLYLLLKAGFSDTIEKKPAAAESGLAGQGQAPRGGENLIRRLKRYLISLFLLLPDHQRNWVIPAALKSAYIIKSLGIDCVLTSGPPHSLHLAGLLAKKFTGVKWVADFRDPFADMQAYKPSIMRCGLSDKIEFRLENLIMKNSDRVLATSDALRKVFMKRYGQEPEDKFLYIPNAIDWDGFAGLGRVEKYKRFTISYLGTLYSTRTPEPVFKAVKNIITDGKIKASDISVKLIGECSFIKNTPAKTMAEDYGLTDVVEIGGPVSYLNALDIMRRSHILLLLASDQPLQVPAKAFDYLGSGSRILAISPEGSATAELIKDTGCGRSFDPSDFAGIGRFICEQMKENHEDGLGINNDRLEQFDIRLLTRKLAREFASIR